eukprot:1334703-Amphidinium_carterae.1
MGKICGNNEKRGLRVFSSSSSVEVFTVRFYPTRYVIMLWICERRYVPRAVQDVRNHMHFGVKLTLRLGF